MTTPDGLPRVDALPLIESTDDALIELLRGLSVEEWERTAVGHWSVRDVAAHLLDGNLRRLSFLRDGLRPPPPEEDISDHAALVSFLNRLNDDWIRATRRLSGRVITDWLEFTSPQVRRRFSELDPESEAPFPVTWAGQDQTAAWLDIAREYTEKWHHQQQIRHATRRPGLTDRRFVEPLLETLVRALPRAYAGTTTPERGSASVYLGITDFPGCGWVLVGANGQWVLVSARDDTGTKPDVEILLPSDTAWRFLMKGLGASEARAHAEIRGASELAEPFFSALAVMA